jgi:hypothetical protein
LPLFSAFVRCCLSFAVVAATLTPARAQAQRGLGRRGLGNVVREQGLVAPKLVNPVNLLIEHRQELTLSDSQFTHIIAIKRVLDSTNAPLVRRIDSVERLFRGGGIMFGDESREHRDSVAEGRMVIREMSAGLRENYSQAKEQAFALLGAQQYAKAEDIYAKAERAIMDEEQARKK